MDFIILGITAVSYRFSYFEVKVAEKENIEFVDIPLTILKEKGVTKSLNGFKKLRTWLESPDGQEYLRKEIYKYPTLQ